MADTTSSSNTSTQMEKGWYALSQYVVDNKINVGLWVTRLFTIIFTVGYIIPIFGYNILSYFFIMSIANRNSINLNHIFYVF